MIDHVDSFRSAMAAVGLDYAGEIIADGTLHRFKNNGDKTTNSWYVLHGDGLPAGTFGDYKRGIKETWCAKSAENLTEEERAERDRHWKQQQEIREAERRRQHDAASIEAQKILDAAQPATDDHPYLKRKQVRAYPGVMVGAWSQRRANDPLLIPLRTAAGKLASVQAIFSEKRGDRDKDFLKGGAKTGAFFVLGDPATADVIYIAEGYATAASVLDAADGEESCWCAIMACDAGNLRPVAEAVHALYPGKRIVIAADNDRATPGNPGLTKATAAAKAIKADLAVPEFAEGEAGSDFNDLAALRGVGVVREALLGAKPAQASRAGAKNKDSSTQRAALSISYSFTLDDLSFIAFTAEVPHLHDYDEKGRPTLIESNVANQLALLMKGRFAFCRESLRWYAFAETHWHAINGIILKELITRMLYAGATEGFKDRTVTAVLSLLEKGLLPLPENRDARALPFLNGLLNLDTRGLVPITPDNAPIWCLPYAYDPAADCPTFKTWLRQAVDGDVETVEFLRAWLAALLTGRADLQKFLHLLGPGGTGKGVFTRLAELLVGKHNATITDLRNLEQNRFETASLYSKRLVCITDASKYGGSVDVLKAMTGQDSLRLERKHQQQGATLNRPGFSGGGWV
ncbi:MAG: toprim domain-containing protein [Gammaproteobacteria bacterium]|nr:toprim domain-containing protein [Gammaproteobacteria bacterium]